MKGWNQNTGPGADILQVKQWTASTDRRACWACCGSGLRALCVCVNINSQRQQRHKGSAQAESLPLHSYQLLLPQPWKGENMSTHPIHASPSCPAVPWSEGTSALRAPSLTPVARHEVLALLSQLKLSSGLWRSWMRPVSLASSPAVWLWGNSCCSVKFILSPVVL